VLVQGDTSDASRAEALIHEAAQTLGGCDIFVQSVIPRLEDIYVHTLATEVPLDKWQLAFDTQVRAFFVGARTAAQYMTRGGRILALSYTPGGRTGDWQPWVGMGSAKAALDSTCRYFAGTLGCHGIDDGDRADAPGGARRHQALGGGGLDAHAPDGDTRGYCQCVRALVH
jgi:enoyl-[acyl-carrier-protein] reductase (NADH)